MMYNFLKVLLRNFWRNKSFSVVSLLGLSIGMAAVLVITLFLQTEYGFDKFHKNADRIYRVTTDVRSASTGETRHYATTTPAVSQSILNEYPQVEEAVRFRRSDNHLITYDDKRFSENNVLYADSGFFKIFSFGLKQGATATALREPNSVVLSEEMARKYFGQENPMGKTIRSDSVDWKVTGVLDKVPVNSHIQPDFLVSFSTWRIPVGYPVTLESWTWVTFPTYILVREKTDISTLRAGLPVFLKKYAGDEIAARRTLSLQPLADIYFDNELLENATFKTGNEKQSKILAIVAVLILVIGCFNFMTLFTASAAKRAREMGVRKVLGAARKSLVVQLLAEATFLTIACVPLALILAGVSIDWFSAMIGFRVPFSWEQVPFAAGLCFGMAILIGLFAGIYPSLQLTAFVPAITIRNLFRVPSGVSFKKALVITQFTISGVLILASVVMYKQSAYITSKELGFESDQLMRIEMPGEELGRRYNYIRNELLKNPQVEQVSKGGNIFRETIGSVPVYPGHSTDRDAAVQMNIQGVHNDFFETFGIELAKGRFISKQFTTDSADAMIVNESAVKAFGWKDDPIGKRIQVGEIKPGVIVGVVKDFHFRTLHTSIGPLVMYVPPTAIDNIFIRAKEGQAANVAQAIETSWHRISPDIPLNLSFADANIDRLYKNDRRFLQLIFLFCALSVFVACMGLYSLTVLIADQRVKEIGIRKVLGAGAAGIATMVSKDFAWLVLVAVLIASPVAWFFLDQWLNEFAYRIDISWWLFAMGAGAVMLIALLTVSVQAIRAALANPVKSLRTE